MAISVAVAVGDETADRLREHLVTAVAELNIGDGMLATTEMGPLISKEHLAKVRGYIATGQAEGAELVVDGRVKRFDGDGYFIGASLFDRVTPDMRIYREEIFGPVLCLVRAETFEEAVRLVNDHEFGNGTAIFTRDGKTANSYLHEVRAGMVGINVPIPVPMAFHSFGGWKRSLFGEHHIHGPEGVRFYTRYKTATTRWPGDVVSPVDFAMPTLT
jgi:malonate-semialdehyde dehydrogenase (acetylating)/methylmalonate-semialdehyde dehydrogenase